MGEEQTVNALFLELFPDLDPVTLLVQQAFVVDVGDVYKFHAQLGQAVPGQVGKLDGIGSRENTPACGGKADFNRTHNEHTLSFLLSYIFYF